MWNYVKEFISKFLKKKQTEFEWKCGWLKDKPDDRDFLFKTTATPTSAKTYTPVDLRPLCPPVMNQRNLGSCSAFGVIGLVQYVRRKQGFAPYWLPSALFTYYNTRLLEGTTSEDSGAMVRNALKSVAKDGVVEERLYPYITPIPGKPARLEVPPQIEKFAEQPPGSLYRRAQNFQALSYRRLNDGSISEMQECLDQGYPFIFGMFIYESFIKCPKTGIIPSPKIQRVSGKDIVTERMPIGGHCMMCVGWKMINNSVYFIIQNSWGTAWGDNGYCYIPAQYIGNPKLASDFWMIRIMEN